MGSLPERCLSDDVAARENINEEGGANNEIDKADTAEPQDLTPITDWVSHSALHRKTTTRHNSLKLKNLCYAPTRSRQKKEVAKSLNIHAAPLAIFHVGRPNIIARKSQICLPIIASRNHFLMSSCLIPLASFLVELNFGGNNLPHNLVKDQLLQLLLTQVILILVKVEELLWNRRGGWLVLWVMVWLEVRVLECLLNRDALNWVESQQLLEKI